VSREIGKKVDLELGLLHKLLDFYRPLVDEARKSDVGPFDLSALSNFLHSFYTGVERVFTYIAEGIDGGLPSGPAWHTRLLTSMSQATEVRPAVISEELYIRLYDYMNFRHMFRHAYAFDLKWRRMSDLVLHCEETLDRLQTELAAFFDQGP
jgi:hypothetical protein